MYNNYETKIVTSVIWVIWTVGGNDDWVDP